MKYNHINSLIILQNQAFLCWFKNCFNPLQLDFSNHIFLRQNIFSGKKQIGQNDQSIDDSLTLLLHQNRNKISNPLHIKDVSSSACFVL